MSTALQDACNPGGSADWHLTLRNESDMLALAPHGDNLATVSTEPLGVNVFLELRKPEGMNDFGRNTRQRRILKKRIGSLSAT